jgi:EmrB/QacA subfamily drug resistance transporter
VATTIPAAPVESAHAHASTYSSKQRKIALVVVTLAFVMDLMDATILNIALPTIQNTLHAGYAALQWMAAGYTLTFALLLITGGRMGDVFGYKRLFLIGVVGFMISSLLVGLAWNPDSLIVARLLQGASAALMVPQVLSVVQLLYKADERVQVNGMMGGLSVLATTLAPIVTGLLIKANIGGLSWRPIFLINIPVCILALFLASKYLPSGKSERAGKIDLTGTALAVVGIGLLVFPLIQGHELGWPAWAYVLLIAAVPVLALFAWSQRRKALAGDSPLVIPALFRHRSFSVGLSINLLVFATIGCFALTFTLLLQLGHQFSAIHTVLTAIFITVGIMPAVGALSKKVIPAMGRWSITVGVVIMALGTAGVGLVIHGSGSGLSTWQLAPALFFIGVGMGLIFAPLLPFILSNVDPQDAGSASGTANAVQQIGGALGVALIGVVFFGHLLSTTDYNQAFDRGIWLQVVILAICAVLSLFLPPRIAPEAYQQQHI